MKQQKKWRHDWNTKVNNKLFSVDSSIGKKDFSGFNTRLEEIKFTRLRLGHTKLTHGFIFTEEPQPVCTVCECNVSIKHILVECPKYELERIRFFGHHEVNFANILERGNYQKRFCVLDIAVAMSPALCPMSVHETKNSDPTI